MKLSFPAPAPALSQNESNRQVWQIRHRNLAAWRDTADLICRSKRWRDLPPSLVTVSIPFATNRRRDPHNYVGTVVKAVVDGLVKAGAWPDDNPDFVKVAEPKLVAGYEVTIEVEPL